MIIEFDFQCGIVQLEDVFCLLIFVRIFQNLGYGLKLIFVYENFNLWIELKKFLGFFGWFIMVLVLLGNEVFFLLEIVLDYVKDDKVFFYGFKCFVIGYEFSFGFDEGVIQLEKELVNFGGVCVVVLMKKDLVLFIGNELEEDFEIFEEVVLQVCKIYFGIFGKGLVFFYLLIILEVFEGNLLF